MKILFLTLLYFAQFSLLAQNNSKIPINIGDATPLHSIDFDESGTNAQKIYCQTCANIIQYLNNAARKVAFRNKISSLVSDVNKTLENNSGFLIKTTIMSDEFGNNYIPNNVVTPIGVGLDPVDSYAHHLNTPSIGNESYSSTFTKANVTYIWIYKKNNQLLFGEVPNSLNKNLVRQAHKLAFEYSKIASNYFNPISSPFPNYIKRALFWKDKLNEQEKILKEIGKYDEISRLTEKYRELQEKQDYLYKSYKLLISKKKHNNSILSILNAFILIGQEFASDNPSDKTNMTYSPEIINNELTIINQTLTIVNKEKEKATKDLNKVDEALKKQYNLM